jgi:paraquat-inducible protein A
MKRYTLRYLCVVNAVLLGVGVAAPCMTVAPSFGNFTGIVKMLQPSFTHPTTFSVLGGLVSLLEDGKYVISFVLFMFSILFPLVKLTVIWMVLYDVISLEGRVPKVLERLGKYSMIDVFVMALLILAIKGLPGGSQITLRWGLYVFGGAALLTIELARALHRKNN